MIKNSIVEQAFSKINLYLHVLGKDEKGYHLLDSLFVFSNIADKVEVSKTDSDKIEIKVTGDFKEDVPEDESNLVVKICYALGIKKGVLINLEKNLPVSSGIGGGSADAGAVMRSLIKMFDIKLSDDEIIKIATSVGADIPACVFSKSSLISGIGEKISYFEMKEKYHILLINPLKKILTKDIFKLGVKTFSAKAKIDGDDLINSLLKTKNDLYENAVHLVPEIADILKDLKNTDCVFQNMSGSGATVFALFDDLEKMELAKAKLQEKYKEYWIRTGKLI